MTIDDALKPLPAEQLIKIGAEKGTGFFYCGTAGEFLKNDHAYSHKLRQLVGDKLNQVNREIEAIKRWIVVTPKKETSVHWKLKNAISSFTAFKHLWKREVVDSFAADPMADEKEPLVFIVEGDEYGTFWVIQDADTIGQPFSTGWREEMRNRIVDQNDGKPV